MSDDGTSASIVPFGKYKGQSVEVLAADSDYCEWLVGQPWFKTKFGNVYNVVVQYGTDTFDTPEHNQMQVAFLENEACMRLAKAVLPDNALAAYQRETARRLVFEQRIPLPTRCLTLRNWAGGAVERQFEVDGWDVVIKYAPYTIAVELADPLEMPDCECGECDHSDCPEDADCRGGESSWECLHRGCQRRAEITPPPAQRAGYYYSWEVRALQHCSPACPYHDEEVVRWFERLGHYRHELIRDDRGFQRLYVECKPDLGDDYPGVLRQVGRYPVETGRRIVLVRRFGSQAVSWEQAVQVFAASDVRLVRESDLEQEATS